VTDFLDSLNGAFGARSDLSVQGLLLSLSLAFLLGQLLAWTYTWTHRGLSYSRAFTQSLVIMAVVIAILMMVIGTSIVTAFGLLGALALVRFRNVLKDTRDTVFVLMSIVIGISAGTQRYATGIVGTVVMLVLVWYLETVSFGSLERFHGYLTIRLSERASAEAASQALLHRYCRRFEQISRRQSDDEEDTEIVYQIGLRDRTRSGELLAALHGVTGVSHASVLLRDELSEV
jgi:uncharacterized membrane protein YhiD involved in acid resistance